MAKNFDTSDFEPISKKGNSSFDTSDFESIDSADESTQPSPWGLESLWSAIKQAPGDIAAAPLDLLSGMISGGRDLGNLVPSMLGYGQPIPPTQDIRESLGLGQGNDAVKAVGSYLPVALSSEVSAPMYTVKGLSSLLGKLGAEGGIYGMASNPEAPVEQALTDAAINVAIPGAGAAGKGALKGIAERYGLPGYAEKILKYVMDTKDLKPTDAVARAENNYQQHLDKENMAWANLDKVTADLQELKLDPAEYGEPLGKRIAEMSRQGEEQSAYARSNKEPIELLQGYLGDRFDNFPNAIEHNKALNRDYKSSLRPTSGQPKTSDELKATKFAIENLQKMLDDNIVKNGLQDTVGVPLENARQSTRDINDIFRQIPDAGGNPKSSLFAQHQKTENPFSDPTNFVSNYTPRTKGDGIQSMQQFAKIIGNESVAKNYMKKEVFNDVIKEGAPDPVKFIREYNNLSGNQRAYLFTPEEQERIKLVNKLVEKYPAKTPKVNFPLWHFGLAGVAGEAIGRVLGVPPAVGALAGVGATLGAEHALYGALSKTGLNEKALNMLLKDKGLNASNSSLINSVAPRGAVTQAPLTGANQ